MKRQGIIARILSWKDFICNFIDTFSFFLLFLTKSSSFTLRGIFRLFERLFSAIVRTDLPLVSEWRYCNYFSNFGQRFFLMLYILAFDSHWNVWIVFKALHYQTEYYPCCQIFLGERKILLICTYDSLLVFSLKPGYLYQTMRFVSFFLFYVEILVNFEILWFFSGEISRLIYNFNKGVCSFVLILLWILEIIVSSYTMRIIEVSFS